MKNIILILFASVLTFTSCTNHPKRIACIGDSITEAGVYFWQNKFSYPAQLDSILGDNFDVLNCGRGGGTMVKKSELTYWRFMEFSNVFVFHPEIVIIKLGTNDTKKSNWNAEGFEKDYQSMIDTLQTIKPKPSIYICLPVPAFNGNWGIRDSVLNAGVIPITKRIAEKNHLKIIDLNSVFKGKPEYFPDSIHMNISGSRLMAEEIAKAIRE